MNVSVQQTTHTQDNTSSELRRAYCSMQTTKMMLLIHLGSLATASAALILGILSTSWCQFASVSFSVTFSPPETVDDVFRMDKSPTHFVTLYLGLWRHQSFGIKNGAFHADNSCEEYGSQKQMTVDDKWMAARTFGILALLIGGMHILIISWLSFRDEKILSRTPLHMKASPWIHLLCCLLQGLTLVMLKKEFCNQSLKQGVETLLESAQIVEWSNKCELGSGLKMAIVSMVFWFMAFVLALLGNCLASKRSATANANANNDRQNEQNPHNKYQKNVLQHQCSVAGASKDDDEPDEEPAAAVESNPSTTVTPRETSSP